ncbi:MAG: recombinase family protein [Dehalococcoidia bacterium]
MSLTKPKFSVVPSQPPRRRGALYSRVSSDDQVLGHSLDYQFEGCHQYAEKNDIEIVESYQDAGFSGTSDARPAFLKMIEDAEAGKFDTIIVYRIDRFARDRHDNVVYKKRLVKAGVRVVSVTEPIDDSTTGQLMEGMLEVMAHHYSLELSHKVGTGLAKRADKGLLNGMIPFAYEQSARPSQDPPVIIPEEARYVVEAFERRATGQYSYRDIADYFNAQGLRTRHRAPKGRPDDGPRLWSGDSVRKMIQSPIYMGMVPYKSETRPGRHEPIVSEDLWRRANRVGERLSRGTSTSYRQVHFYALAGILRCAECGSTLQGNHTDSGKGHRYYRGSCVRRGVNCKMLQRTVRADEIEAQVDEIVGPFKAPKELRDAVIKRLGQSDGRLDPAAEIARLQERLKRITRLYADLMMEEAEFSSERRRLEAEIDRLSVPIAQAEKAAEQFDVLQLAWKKATPHEKRSLGLALFEQIRFSLDDMEIVEVVVNPAFRPWIK